MSENTTLGYFQRAIEIKQFAEEQMHAMEKEVHKLIARKEKDKRIISCLLDILELLVEMGVSKTLYEQLHRYYVSIDRKSKR